MAKTRFGYKGKLLSSSLLIACVLGFAGCGGSNEVASPRSGKLIGGIIVDKTDSNGNVLKTVPRKQDISGLSYRSGRRVGVTDTDGTFFYQPGETIEFAIDKIIIGKLETSTTESGYAYTKLDANNSEYKYFVPTTSTDEDRILVASMRDIAAGRSADFGDARVINFIKFIECLDANKTSSDGVDIAQDTAKLVQTVCDSLGIAEIDFSSDSQIKAIISGMNSIVGEGAYVLPDDASKMRNDLYASYAKYKAMPIAYFNIGDGFMAGCQSGAKNIHEATQNRGFARIGFDLLGTTSNILTWYSPKLSMDSTRAITRKTETDADGNSVIYIPSNLAYPGASCLDILSKYTGTGDTTFDELIRPIADSSYLNTPVTQMDAAIYSASQDSTKGRIMIFTILAGMQDVYKNIIPGTSASLDNVTTGLDSMETVKNSLTQIVSKIRSEYPDAKIFIGNIPDVDTLALSLSIDDIASFVSNSKLNGISSPSLEGLPQGSRVGLDAFIAKIAPTLYPGTGVEAVNATLSSLSTSEILSQEELNELKTRSDAINAHIASLTDGKTVFPVDVNGLFRDYKNNKFAIIDDKYIIRVTDEGIGETTSTVKYMTPIWGGGLFSSDGYYLSHTGNAMVANAFFSAMAKAGLGFDPEYMAKPTALTVNNDKNYWYINIEAAWNIDVYRDYDGDGFPIGPGTMPPTDTPLEYIPVADPYFYPLEDCDDETTSSSKVNKLPKAVTGLDCVE